MSEKFRKKPVVIEARHWDGRDIEPMILFLTSGAPLPKVPDDPHIHSGIGFTPPLGTITIPTLEGTLTASPGDWIIKGVKGEFYPCKPDIFAATYEPVQPAASSSRPSRMAELLTDLQSLHDVLLDLWGDVENCEDCADKSEAGNDVPCAVHENAALARVLMGEPFGPHNEDKPFPRESPIAATLRSEFDALTAQAEWERAEAFALVLSHEAQINALTAKLADMQALQTLADVVCRCDDAVNCGDATREECTARIDDLREALAPRPADRTEAK